MPECRGTWGTSVPYPHLRHILRFSGAPEMMGRMASDYPKPGAARRSSANHYHWGNACDGWVLSSDPKLLVIEEHVPPGESEEWHVHDHAQQFFYVLCLLYT